MSNLRDPRCGMRPCPCCRSITQWITLAGIDQCWWCSATENPSRPRAGQEVEEGQNECVEL